MGHAYVYINLVENLENEKPLGMKILRQILRKLDLGWIRAMRLWI
jgi:hypothetical protein